MATQFIPQYEPFFIKSNVLKTKRLSSYGQIGHNSCNSCSFCQVARFFVCFILFICKHHLCFSLLLLIMQPIFTALKTFANGVYFISYIHFEQKKVISIHDTPIYIHAHSIGMNICTCERIDENRQLHIHVSRGPKAPKYCETFVLWSDIFAIN